MGVAAGNGTEAARLAGYKGNDVTLCAVGSQNLRNPQIRKAIDERAEEDPKIATREQRQKFWTEVMLGTGDNGFVEMRDRLKASELLGKTHGDFVEKLEVKTEFSWIDLVQSAAAKR